MSQKYYTFFEKQYCYFTCFEVHFDAVNTADILVVFSSKTDLLVCKGRVISVAM